MGIKRAIGLAAAASLAIGAAQTAVAQSADEVAVSAAKQWSGSDLTIFLEAGLSELGFELSATNKWEELTGIKMNIAGAPTNEMYSKIVLEHEGGTGAYDVVDVQPPWMPDLVEIGALEPLDPFIEKYGYAEELQDIAPFFREAWNTYKGTTYAFGDDGDVLLLYYRKDLFEDADNRTKFKAVYGYDLAPPRRLGPIRRHRQVLYRQLCAPALRRFDGAQPRPDAVLLDAAVPGCWRSLLRR